jgi:signal transduction histidine kinase
VKELTEELNRAGLFKIEVIEVDMNESRLSNSTKLMLFRIVQEQMNNILKYAQAKQVWLSFIMTTKKLVLLINDDGLGFDPKQKTKGIGFKNMESRVAYLDGTVQLDSVPGHGATLKVSIPL